LSIRWTGDETPWASSRFFRARRIMGVLEKTLVS
jgi:hypothetical protein